MSSIIDYDNPDTFPKVLHKWRIDFQNMILSKISLEGVSKWWQIEQQLQELHIEEELVKRFVE